MLTKKLAVLLSTALLGCSGQGNDMESATPQALEGEIRVAGAEPMTMVMLQPTTGDDEVRLQGALVEELRRLSGVTVAVSGRRGESAMQGFEVTDYEITSVQGQRPSVGTLVSRDDGWWLEGDSDVRLSNVPAGLRAQAGAKVWVVGSVADGALRLESYGVIKAPQ